MHQFAAAQRIGEHISLKDMEEFMLALGEDDLVEQIKKFFQTDTPLPSAFHDAAMQLYRQYLVVGGMPECVMQFLCYCLRNGWWSCHKDHGRWRRDFQKSEGIHSAATV